MYSYLPTYMCADTSIHTLLHRSGRGDKTAFPSIHVDKCEKRQPAYAAAAASFSPVAARRSPEEDVDVDSEVHGLVLNEP